jgi:hypothetical protein
MNPFSISSISRDNFCNRTHEIATLQQYMRSGIHAVVYLRDNNLGAASSVRTAVDKLLKLDLIEYREGSWRTVDPVLEKWLRRYPV